LTSNRWYYSAVVIDLFARKVVGWAMSLSPDSNLTLKALELTTKVEADQVDGCFTQTRESLYKLEVPPTFMAL